MTDQTLEVTRMDGSRHAVLFDAADAVQILGRTWHVKESARVPGLFYAQSNYRKPDGGWTQMPMHIWLMGRPWIDHINHNGLDNRRSNLRAVTRGQNGANRKPKRGGTSQYKGVSWYKRANKWTAEIRFDGQRRHLGYFRSEVAAAAAYDRAACEVFGDFAFLNLPSEVGS